MKKIKQLKKELDEYGDDTWRRRCAIDTGFSYQTVINAVNGRHPNIEIMKWVKAEIDNNVNMFI